MKKIMSALAILCLTCFASFAQTNVSSPWQGFYFGAGVGGIYDNNQIKKFINNVGNAAYNGSFYAGYDLANVGPNVFGTNNLFGNNMVFGLWTAYNPAEGKSNVMNLFRLYNNGDWQIGGRMGLTIASNFLVYGTGGYTLGDYQVKGLLSSHSLSNLGGYNLGGGVEFMLAQNVFAKLEYAHDGFTHASLNAGKLALEDAITNNRVTLGMSYKFGGSNAPLPLGSDSYYRPLK